MASNTQHPSKIKAWIEAMRLRTLPVSIAGVVAGCGCAAFVDSFRWLPALICLVFAIIAQVASNFANEYYDFRNGLDRKGREGFRRGVTEGDITPRAMKIATFSLLAFDALLGCSLIFFGGWWLIIPGILIAAFALCYSTGPYPLSHHGLGDIAVIIFFGIVPVTLTCYVQAGNDAWTDTTLLTSVAVGLLAANVLIVNNYRDREDDEAAGKHTTVVIFGRHAMSRIYLLSGWVACSLAAVAVWGEINDWWALLWVFGMVQVYALFRRLRRSRGKELNPLLGKTAALLLLLTILFTIALSLHV